VCHRGSIFYHPINKVEHQSYKLSRPVWIITILIGIKVELCIYNPFSASLQEQGAHIEHLNCKFIHFVQTWLTMLCMSWLSGDRWGGVTSYIWPSKARGVLHGWFNSHQYWW
jgi:hypothetical protein